MKYEAVTIKDIAKALGLSTSTVSRALRDSYEISPETKKRVIEYAQEINYRPNPIALSLKEKRSQSIGIIVCEIANSFFSQAINGIESIAYDKGYNVIIAQSHESYEREILNLQYLASRSIDGLLISVSSETENFDHLMDLHKRGFPIVFFDRIVDSLNTHKVSVDNYKGAYDATIELINNGHQNIAMVAGSEFLSITKERVAGYAQALSDHNITFDATQIEYCLHGGMLYEEVETAIARLLTNKNKPSAVIASADKLTTNCLRYFKKQGLQVPDNIAMIGFSNLDLTDLLSPSLSVIRQPAYEIGQVAIELLIKQIENKRPTTAFEKIILPPQMIIRESSGAKKTR
jgi:LacI family transcriptional regulator